MKMLATVRLFKLLQMNKIQQLKYIKANLNSKEFMELLYLGYHTSIDFRFKLDEFKPRPQIPKDNHKTFFLLAMNVVKDQFNENKRKELKEWIKTTDGLSQYIYAKIVNKTLGLSRNDLEEHIPGLITKEPYEIVADFGSPKVPCIIQTYNRGVEAIVTIGDLGVSRDINTLKDKSGVAISGFDEHLLDFKALSLKGTFNVVISGLNEEVFLEHSLGNITRVAAWEPIIITDYSLALPLSERLSIVEAMLIEHPTSLIKLADSFWIKDLEDFNSTNKYDTAIARQDVEPVLWERGEHSINVSFLL